VARENLPSSVPVFAGIQALSLEEAIERSREAENAGADGTLVLPPFDHFAYRTLANRPNVPYEFFNALSDSVDLPIIIFYYPKSTGMNYPIEELEKIATVDNVVAIKALEGSSADYYPIYKALKGKISVLASNDTPDLMGIMMLGSDGALIGVSSIGTQFWAEFVTACLEKRYTEARDLFVQRLSPLTEEIFTPPPGRRDGAHEAAGKEALVQLGIFSSSKVRPPKLNVSQNDKEVIRRVLSQTGLLESMVPAR
jgi:4-hydroxy-tetrahydrodipicolinate synthase